MIGGGKGNRESEEAVEREKKIFLLILNTLSNQQRKRDQPWPNRKSKQFCGKCVYKCQHKHGHMGESDNDHWVEAG